MEEETIEVCVICDRVIGQDDKKLMLKRKGIQGLIKASYKRRDKKYAKLKEYRSVLMHMPCYSAYTKKSGFTAADLEPKDPSCARGKRPLRPAAIFLPEPSISYGDGQAGDDDAFDFAENCFVCGTDASDEFYEKQQRIKDRTKVQVRYVDNDQTRETLLRVLKHRKDDASQEVYARILGVDDLVAVGARTHLRCYQDSIRTVERSRLVGRPVNPEAHKCIDYIIDHVLCNTDECQFSVRAILDEYPGRGELTQTPTLAYIKIKLISYFGTGILVRRTRRDVIFCFPNVGRNVIVQHHNKRREKDEALERERIVRTASLIVYEDVRSRFYDTEPNKTPSHSLEDIEKDIPRTLKLFLDGLIKKGKKSDAGIWNRRVATLAHSIISSVRPKSFVSQVLLGVSTILYKERASKYLINFLSSFGLCSSYEETLRFESSALQDPQELIGEKSFLHNDSSKAKHDQVGAEDGSKKDDVGADDASKTDDALRSVTRSRKRKRIDP